MRPTTRLWETFAVAAIMGIASGVCLAAGESKESAKLPQADGEIASIDALGSVVTLKESTHLDPATGTIAQPTSYLVNAKTMISKDRQPLTLADVQVGDQATIEYTTTDGKRVASSIAIQSPAGAKPGQTVAAPAAKSSTTSSAQ